MDLSVYEEDNTSGSGAWNESCKSATGLFIEINGFPAAACLLLLVCLTPLTVLGTWKRATGRFLHTGEICFIFGYAATCASALVRRHLGVKLCQNVIIYNVMTSSCFYLWLYSSAFFLQKALSLFPPEHRFRGRMPSRLAIALEVLVHALILMFVVSGCVFEFMYVFHESTGGVLQLVAYDFIFDVYTVFGFFANVFLFGVYVFIAGVGVVILGAKKFLTDKNIRSFGVFILIAKLPIGFVFAFVQFGIVGFIFFSVITSYLIVGLTASEILYNYIMQQKNARVSPPRRPQNRATLAEREPLLPSPRAEHLTPGTRGTSSVTVQSHISIPVTFSGHGSNTPQNSEHIRHPISSPRTQTSPVNINSDHSSVDEDSTEHSPIPALLTEPCSSRSPTGVVSCSPRPLHTTTESSQGPIQTTDPSHSPTQTI